MHKVLQVTNEHDLNVCRRTASRYWCLLLTTALKDHYMDLVAMRKASLRFKSNLPQSHTKVCSVQALPFFGDGQEMYTK